MHFAHGVSDRVEKIADDDAVEIRHYVFECAIGRELSDHARGFLSG